jgi:hypothetical protein
MRDGQGAWWHRDGTIDEIQTLVLSFRISNFFCHVFSDLSPRSCLLAATSVNVAIPGGLLGFAISNHLKK